MYFLIRRKISKDSAETLDTEYEGKILTLGASSAQVMLGGVKGVLTIAQSAGHWQASANGVELEHNGKSLQQCNLALGDTLFLHGHKLEILSPPGGFDFALLLTSASSATDVNRPGLDIDRAAWSMRRSSWLLALLVLLIFLIGPLVDVLRPDIASFLRSSPLPDDSLWSTGPLARAHQTSGIASDCQACHTEPFTRVEDKTCMSCHRDISEHVDVVHFAAQNMEQQRCASCHREHNEPAHIIRTDDKLCVDCHIDPQSLRSVKQERIADLEAVTTFSDAGHPDFRLSLLLPKGLGATHGWERERVRVTGSLDTVDKIKEQSNLKFNHAIHLDAGKVENETSGEALVCASCHSLREDREHFEPITMDKNCRSCHSLNFDMFEPDLELPHGDQRAAIVAMEAHFIREFTDPALRAQRAGSKLRRIPGKREAPASCEGSGLECGRAEALKEAQYQFAETGCITCHEVTETGLSDISDRWFIQPVRLTGDWYPFARFDHSSHLSLSWDSEGEVCEACHKARVSEVSADILMPDKPLCLACHSSEPVALSEGTETDAELSFTRGYASGVSSQSCIACHAFHQPQGSLSSSVRSTKQ